MKNIIVLNVLLFSFNIYSKDIKQLRLPQQIGEVGKSETDSSEIVNCEIVDFPNLGTNKSKSVSVDVYKTDVDSPLATFKGEEGFKIEVNVFKRSIDKMYLLDANIIKKGERSIFGRAFSPTLPITIQLGNMNEKTQAVSWLTMICKK